MNDDINQEQTNENINDLLTTSMNNLNFDDEAEYGISIGILEYAYSLKHHRFQNLIEAYEQALTNQLNNDNKSILSFEIISKTEIDGKAVDPVVLSVQSEEISSKISELITILKKPEGYQSKGEAWQMVVDIPYGFTADNIESAINADAVFCYLLASSWVNNYSNDSKTFLFSRTNLKAGLRIDSESQSCQILLIFYDKNEPQDDSNKNLEETKQNENKQGGGFMKSPNRSIRKSAKDLNVPRKYDNMRQSPQEVPLDVIKKLFLTIDQDIDDRISAEEIKNYIRKVKLTIEESVADELFHECADRRVVVHQKQKLLPLTFDEVVAAIRGRYSWNMVEKKWDVSYRPMRTYWIILLKTISEKVFAIPVPQIKPTKILAQFELNEIMMRKRNMEKQAGTIKTDVNVPTYQRVENKPGSEYLMNFITRVLPEPEFNPYEYQINRRVKPTSDDDGNANPKIGYEAKAFFEQSLSITKKDPTWTSPDKNPIMYYIPARQLPDSAYLPKAAFAQTPQQTGNPGRSAEGFNLVDAEGKLRNIGGKLNNRSKRSEKSMPSTPFEGEEHSVKTFSRNPTKSIENTVNGDEPSNVLFGPNGTLRNFTKSQVALTEFKKKQILKGNKRAEVAGLQNPEPSKK